nr:ABC transporter permease [Halomarina sp. PSR21]
MSNETFDPVGRVRDLSARGYIALAALATLAALALAGTLFPASVAGVLYAVLTRPSTVEATLRLSVPICLAALGGIFAEKSGVINIGLEGLLIVSAFAAVYGADVTNGNVWAGMAIGTLASVLLAAVFAVVCIEFRADQIIAGLAIWLVALGFAPFAAQVIYDSKNVDPSNVPTLPEWQVAGFDLSASVYLMFVAVAVAWYVLNRTAFGRWVVASGENPKALDTVGVSVHRIRYAAVLLSGVFAGVGGASLSLGLGTFIGGGQTMVGGRGFIAIVAYLFGNYNPIGAFLSTFLFSGLQSVQTQLQFGGIAVSDTLIQTIPYLTVIVVLALVGRTRIPKAAGEHYESGED